MAHNTSPKTGKGTSLVFLAGDTETVRLNIKDSLGVPLDLSTGFLCKMGIKRRVQDDAYIVPQKDATLYDQNQGYNIEIVYTSTDTQSILRFDGKPRKSLLAYYDVELNNTLTGEVTTVLVGLLTTKKTIAGVV